MAPLFQDNVAGLLADDPLSDVLGPRAITQRSNDDLLGRVVRDTAESMRLDTIMQRYFDAMDPVKSQGMLSIERMANLLPMVGATTGGLIAKVPGGGTVLGAGPVRRSAADLRKKANIERFGYDPNEVDEIIAYHGSPHDFNNFDIKKIGAGEGVQQYGHGLYFTDLEKIAREYNKNLTPRDLDYEDWLNAKYKKAESAEDYAQMELLENAMMYDRPVDFKAKAKDKNRNPEYREKAAKLAEEIEEFDPKLGSVFKVSIKSKIEDMVDYDSPISQQSEKVKKAWEKLVNSKIGKQAQKNMNVKFGETREPIGRDFLSVFSEGLSLAQTPKYREKTTEFLRRENITGIRYADQWSRNQNINQPNKKRTDNYVIFDDSLIETLAKFGLLGGAVVTGNEVAEGVLGSKEQKAYDKGLLQ